MKGIFIYMKISDEFNKIEKELKLCQDSYYITNDFLCIREKSKDKL